MERYSKHVEMLEHERAQAEQMKQCPVTTLQSESYICGTLIVPRIPVVY